MAKKPKPCEWVTLEDALRTFVLAEEGTQSSSHILPMHWHVACRLVVEGGFHPDYVYAAKLLRSRTRRLVWDRDSPAVWDPRTAGMTPRIGDDTAEPAPSFEVDESAAAEEEGTALGSDQDDESTD